MKDFRLLTITHKTANITHIGKYIPTVNEDPEKLAAQLKKIKTEFKMEELLYVATCNRLTFFFVRDVEITDLFIIEFFRKLHPNIPEWCLGGILDVLAVYKGIDCVKHVFEIAASLDSLVVGESEIIRQLRVAYDFGKEHDLVGDQIRLVVEMAIPVAKEIHTRTNIGANNVSVVSLAVTQMMSHDVDKDAHIMMIGAGETNNLAAKILLNKGYSRFTVLNRTLEKAEFLAEKLKGKALALSEIQSYTDGFDVLFCCTSADIPIITSKLYEKLLQGDTNRKVIIDLGVPADVTKKVSSLFDVAYVNVEGLRQLASQNLAARFREVQKANNIIDRRLEDFKLSYRQRNVELAMAVIPEQIQAIKDRALNNVFKKEVEELDDDAKTVLAKVVEYIEKKYISIPMATARKAVEEELKKGELY